MLALLVLAEVRVQAFSGVVPYLMLPAILLVRYTQESLNESITRVLQVLQIVKSMLFEPLGGRFFTSLHPVQKYASILGFQLILLMVVFKNVDR